MTIPQSQTIHSPNNKVNDINDKDVHGNTELHCAANQGDFERVKLLISKGADQSILNDSGFSALAVAADGEELPKNSLVKHLIENGGSCKDGLINSTKLNGNDKVDAGRLHNTSLTVRMYFGKEEFSSSLDSLRTAPNLPIGFEPHSLLTSNTIENVTYIADNLDKFRQDLIDDISKNDSEALRTRFKDITKFLSCRIYDSRIFPEILDNKDGKFSDKILEKALGKKAPSFAVVTELLLNGIDPTNYIEKHPDIIDLEKESDIKQANIDLNPIKRLLKHIHEETKNINADQRKYNIKYLTNDFLKNECFKLLEEKKLNKRISSDSPEKEQPNKRSRA